MQNQLLAPGRKLFLGALGAATPLVLNLLVVDHLALSNPTLLTGLGYVIRVVGLIGLGVLVVSRSLDEDRPARIFLLGLAGPALVTALLNGINQRSLLQAEAFVPRPAAAVLSLPIAYAAQNEPVHQFVIPAETGVEQIWRGLLGCRSDRIWFVIVGRETTREAAQAASDRINRTVYGFRAEVFEPYHGRGPWCIVIGQGLTKAEATRMKERALGAGLTGVDVWTIPPST
jgi:hypothetical protein